jgi:hypothetical protein
MIPKLPDLRRAVIAVLREYVRPLHYKDLTRLALGRLDLAPKEDVNEKEFRCIAEDVREKVLQQGSQHGLGYIGHPECLGYLLEWFPKQTSLINGYPPEKVVPTTDLCLVASTDALLRHSTILKKSGTDLDHAKRVARGFLIQHVVADYFRNQWPSLWRPASNAGQFARPSADDFRLYIPSQGRVITVDVAGPHRDGLFGATRGGKPAADLHIVASIEHGWVMIHGFVWPDQFQSRRFSTVETQPFVWLRCFLNCEVAGIDYESLLERVCGKISCQLIAREH